MFLEKFPYRVKFYTKLSYSVTNLKPQIHRISCFPYRHFERSEKSSLHSALSCSFRKRFPLFRCLTYGAIPVCQKDPSASLGMTLRGIALSKHIHCTLREINPFPLPSFRAQSRNLPCTPSFLAPFAERFSPFPLSHIRRYTGVQERSLDFARDDDTGITLSKHIRCTLREINPFPHAVISSAARNLPCTLLFLAPFAKGFPFSAITHTALYQCARKIPRLRSG